MARQTEDAENILRAISIKNYVSQETAGKDVPMILQVPPAPAPGGWSWLSRVDQHDYRPLPMILQVPCSMQHAACSMQQHGAAACSAL